MADFIAACTSYATHGEPMIPFYIFYSMFGWQRTADQMWQLADQLGKGFIVGATAGRTTLTGEGLQHADGHSHLIASTNPASLNYDPAFAYEIAVIVKDGLRRMYGEKPEDVFYYMTVYNEPKVQPAMPEGVEEGILKGLYRFNTAADLAEAAPAADAPKIQLMASGTAIHWILEAQKLLAADWNVAADVWSATSWGELRRDALECDEALLRGELRTPYVTRALEGVSRPGARRLRLDASGPGPDQPVGRAGLHLAGHGRLRPVRHPRRRPPPLRCRRPVDRGGRAGAARPPRRSTGVLRQGGPGALRPVRPRARAHTAKGRCPPRQGGRTPAFRRMRGGGAGVEP